jgi:uncharacterized protein YndB with AHSA1/START domain
VDMAAHNQTQITIEPGKQELTIVREFDAPRELVFEAHTDPELFAQWIGPREYATEIKTFEPRDGGSYRFISKDAEGNHYGFRGVYHEVTPPEKIIWTFEYEDLPENRHVSLEIADFEALPGGRTKLVSHSIYESVADRDGMVESGVEEGVNEGYERLDELLDKMKKMAA